MGFVKVTSTKKLSSANMLGVELGERKILIVNLNGKYYAIGNVCTHLACMLSDGELKGETVQCPCHGSIFNVKTGNVVKGPAKRSEPTFEVKVEGEQILVNL